MTISKLYYQSIDLEQTGVRLKKMLESSGYTPKMVQEYLHLSCVQPIYRWYKGLILPSVDHLFMLSELLNVHMEEERNINVVRYTKTIFRDVNAQMYDITIE